MLILRMPLATSPYFTDAVDLGDDRRFARLAGFEQFDHARQTAGDVLGLGSGARDLREHVAGVHQIVVGSPSGERGSA